MLGGSCRLTQARLTLLSALLTDSAVRDPAGALFLSVVAVIAPHLETTGLMFRITDARESTTRPRA
jgi:hypothetical protein